MSGEASKPSDVWTPAGQSQVDLSTFAQTDEGKKYSADQINALANMNSNGKGGYQTGVQYNPVNPLQPIMGGQDVTDVATAYLNWKSAQDTQQKNFGAYQELVRSQPGRDQTILTGAAMSPNNIQNLPGPTDMRAKQRIGVPQSILGGGRS